MSKSNYSSTMIGHGQSDQQRHHIVSNNYKNEAIQISKYTSTLHPSRINKTMQIQYPVTLQRLSSSSSSSNNNNNNSNSSLLLTNNSNKDLKNSTNTRIERENEFMTKRKEELKQEYSLNDRKKRYNRDCGTHAVVSDILHGTAQPVQEPLFPQKASHQQVLMITGKLTMPDANKAPPDVPRQKKWLGSELGWQT